MPVPTLEDERLNVVCLGSFNPAIFHPEWLVRMGLLTEEDARDDLAKVKVVSHEVADVGFLGMKLQCLPERLSLETPNPARFEALQELLIRVLEILPHTPLTACGINRTVHYRVHDEEYWHSIGHALVPKDSIWKPLFDDPRTQSVSIKQKREGDFPGDINVTVQPSIRYHPGIVVQTNWHHPLPVPDRKENSSSKIRDFLRAEWTEACSIPKIVAGAIFSHV